MKIAFTKAFEKQLSEIKDEKLLNEIAACVNEAQNADSLSEINHVKKLKGYKTAFRIKTGNYRIGFVFEDGTIIFAACLHRKEIYRKFP